jgi:hypothetical protein
VECCFFVAAKQTKGLLHVDALSAASLPRGCFVEHPRRPLEQLIWNTREEKMVLTRGPEGPITLW